MEFNLLHPFNTDHKEKSNIFPSQADPTQNCRYSSRKRNSKETFGSKKKIYLRETQAVIKSSQGWYKKAEI